MLTSCQRLPDLRARSDRDEQTSAQIQHIVDRAAAERQRALAAILKGIAHRLVRPLKGSPPDAGAEMRS